MLPKVSIVIPVYNGQFFLQECIDSILRQTFNDFEIIFVNDSSTDNTYNELIEFQKQDNRIRVVNNNSHNLVDALNLGIQASCGVYIARMDIDDKMNPNRLLEQVTFMENHPEVTVCSSWARCFGLSNEIVKGFNGPTEFPLACFLSGNYIIHPTVMLRRDFLVKNRIRYKQYLYAEDYQFWIDIAKHGGQFWTLPKELIQYRVSESQISNKHKYEQCETALKIKNELLEYLIQEKYFPDNTIVDIVNNLAQYNNLGYINANTIFLLCQEILLTHNLLKKHNQQ